MVRYMDGIRNWQLISFVGIIFTGCGGAKSAAHIDDQVLRLFSVCAANVETIFSRHSCNHFYVVPALVIRVVRVGLLAGVYGLPVNRQIEDVFITDRTGTAEPH